MPSKIAVRKCADLVFLPPRLEVYRAVSRQIHATFTEYTSLIEPLSLDEAYLDMADHLREEGNLQDRGYSNEKIFFQSLFILMTVQFFFFASA